MKYLILILVISINILATICCDGTYSSSTGRGTCSHHGGVCNSIPTARPTPNTPTNLNAICTDNKIKLTWNNSSYNTSFYKIYYSPYCNQSYTYLDEVYSNSYIKFFDNCNVCFKIKACTYSYCSSYSNIVKGENKTVTSYNTETLDTLPIVDGAGSLIRPEILNTVNEKKCKWGCYRDEADMQIHSSPSIVSFQWKQTSKCKKLKIGLLADKEYRTKYNTWINPNNLLKVKIYIKKWSDDFIYRAFETTLPKTIEYVDKWNNIIIVSKEPLVKKTKIIAECTQNDDYKDINMLNDTMIDLPLDYKFAGQGSIIRNSNIDYDKQKDGIYQDVAIGLSSNRAITLFQWQKSSNCSSLILKSGYYPMGNGIQAIVNEVSIKSWNENKWKKNICNKKLPCTINTSSANGNYYIIKIKTDINTLDGNRVSAVCKN